MPSKDLKHEIEELKLLDNVSIYNFLPQEDLIKELFTNDIFLYPSLNEGSALITYEAMAAGLPLIVSNESGSICKNNENGYIFNAGDIDDIVRLVKKLEDKTIRSSMSANSVKAIENLFSESLYEAFEKVYKKSEEINE